MVITIPDRIVQEIWKPVNWYEGFYEISNLWKIKSLNYKRTWKEKILKLSISKKNYSYFNMNSKTFRIHRLVATHFIPNPENLPLVCHRIETLDKNWALYNWSDNLFWWTYSDNIKDCYSKNRRISYWKWKFWKDNPNSKKVNQYTKEWVFIKTWDSIMDAGRWLNLNFKLISACCIWIQKSSWNFIWKFY